MARTAQNAVPAAGSQTLERGLRVLALLGEHPDGLSVTEIAAALRTHRAGVYRLLAPLADARLAHRRADGRYTLGVGLIELASRVHARLQEVALPQLRRLADELRATTALTLRDGAEAVVAVAIEPRSTDMHVAYRIGMRHPVDRGAAGIALLAGAPATDGERPEVAQARRRGWARSTGELLPGASGVAAPILVGGTAQGALSAVWTDARDEAAVAERVLATAEAIAAGLG